MRCCFRSLLLAGFFLALAASTFAQRMSNLEQGGVVRVHVVTTNDHPVGQGLRVRLMGAGGGSPVAESFTDNMGEVVFSGVEPGTYHVVVTGQGYEETDSGSVDVDRRSLSGTLFLRMRPAASGENPAPGAASNSMVDASLLKAPRKAIKELQKGVDLLRHKQWAEAAEHLRKALEIDPGLVDAYNNLAIACSQMGDHVGDRAALDHALKLNDHSEAALVNRAKIALREKDLGTAETLLSRASAVDPLNTETLMLLTKVELVSGHLADAVTTAQHVHLLPHQQYAVVHYLAARALEGESRPLEAVAELKLFLQEDSGGQLSAAARKELGLLEAGRNPSLEASRQ